MTKQVGNLIGISTYATTGAAKAIWNLFHQIAFKRNSNWPLSGFIVSGGNVDALEPGNGYTYHTFTSPGTFTITAAPTGTEVELLIVGAGGGGGCCPNGYIVGGVGAGGLRNITNIPVSAGTYSISVGSGTPTGSHYNGASPPSATTSALGYSTRGGGQGTHYNPGSYGSAGPGGSGGGHGVHHNYASVSGGTGNIGGFSPPEGNPGGSGPTNSGQGGGGSGGSGSSGTGGSGTTLPAYTGPLIGVPGLSPLNGVYSKGGGPGGPGPINNSGNGANSSNNGSPGIVVIRYQK